MENGKLCINLYINKFEQQFNHSTMPVLKYTNITYKCVGHVKCSCFNKKILINQNKCCSFSWLMIEDWNNNSMQHNVQIWFKTSARDRGTTLLIILYILILLIALSTWIRTLAIDCVVSTSSSNWPFSERKGSFGSNRSIMLNPLSAM